MLTQDKAHSFAKYWIESWNSHDLDAIMSHYSDNIVLTSPVAAKLLGDPAGNVKGKAALRAYFEKGLEFYPQLRFDLVDVMWGLSSVVLYYTNQNSTKSGEFMEFGEDSKIIRVVASYGS